ncbi:Copia protein [Leucoagaricus sp. SymC.cos]|nr:Copia protein [Leucoagaricus sp. SymC.cos]
MESGSSLPILNEPKVDVMTYQQLISSLMYAMVCTRPDISYAVGIVACHIATPSEVHLKAVKQIFHYLQETSDYKLTYRAEEGPDEPVVYSDSDWAGDRIDHKSITGYVTHLAGGAITWASCKQACVSTSSTEAKFIAATTGCQEALWLCNFFDSIHLSITIPISLCSDNQFTINLITTGNVNECTKHIDTKYRFICDHNESGDIVTSYIPTDQQPADGFTKALPPVKFVPFISALGLM